MIKISYYGYLSDKPIHEYLCVAHGGYAGQKAVATLWSMADSIGCDISKCGTMESLCEVMGGSQHPSMIETRKNGKFHNVIKREWSENNG